MELDNIHINFAPIDGYNKDFNYIASPREDGKTTTFVAKKAWPAFKKWGLRTIVVNRNICDITQDYVQTFADIIREFCNEEPKFKMPSNVDMQKGIATMTLDDKPVFTFIGLSKTIQSLKKIKYYNTAFIMFDEFFVNPKYGEKYLPMEANKFMDLYNTIYRDNKGDDTRPRVKCYFLGNPVSLYNPHLGYWHVDTRKLGIKGEPNESVFQSGEKWAVWRKTLSRELYDQIKIKNPGYSLEGNAGYTDYALNGENVNDANIRIEPKSPNDYRLRYIFQFEETTIGCFQNNDYANRDDIFYCKEVKSVSKHRDVFCFDFSELSTGGVLMSATERMRLANLRSAMRLRAVEFSNIEIAYKMQEIYNYL